MLAVMCGGRMGSELWVEEERSEVRAEECLFAGEETHGVKVEVGVWATEMNGAVWMNCLRLEGGILSSAVSWFLSCCLLRCVKERCLVAGCCVTCLGVESSGCAYDYWMRTCV